MSQGARNWPFLILTGRPVAAAASRRSVCRQRKAGICKQIDDLGDGRALRRLMHIRRDGKPQSLADLGEDRQRLLESEAAPARRGGAIGLVERGLEDEADVQAPRDFFQRRCRFERMGAALHARRDRR